MVLMGERHLVDLERAREYMVDNQLRTSNVTDWRILAQMSVIPRELFVPQARRELAYLDDVQWLGEVGRGRFISSPATLARLIQLAEISESDSVLDVGPASGYSTAVIAGLCATVVGLEQDAALAQQAGKTLGDLGIGNARVLAGEAKAVGAERFDAIVLQGAVETVPEELLKLLKDGGRLVALVRRGAVAVATIYVKTGSNIAARQEFNASLPPLFVAKPVEEFVF
jgi:protein-L-isoaspartate(D-aspartate) O-methyltransferase